MMDLYHYLHSIVLNNLFIFSMILITGFIWGSITNRLIPASVKEVFTVNIQTKKIGPNLWKTLIIMAITLTFLINSYLRLASSEPLGGDTLWNVYYLNQLKWFSPLEILFNFDRPFFYGMLYFIQVLFSLSAIDVFRVLPGVLSAAYVLAYYLYSKALFLDRKPEGSWALVFFVTFFAGISTISLRMFADLHTMTMSLIFQLLLFTFLLRYINNQNPKYLLFSSAFLVAVLFSHWPTFLLTALFLISFNVFSLFYEDRYKVSNAIMKIMFIPSLILSLFMIFQVLSEKTATVASPIIRLVFPSQASELLNTAVTSEGGTNIWGFFDTSLASTASYAHKILLGDIGNNFGNIIPSLLAIVGLLFIMKARDSKSRFISSNIAFFSVLVLLPAVWMADKWRLALYLPLPILAGVGLNFLLNFGKKINVLISRANGEKHLIKTGYLSIIPVVIILVVSINLAVDWQDTILKNKPYQIDESAQSELAWLEEHYGVANEKLVVITRDPIFRTEIGYRLSPRVIYMGDLFYLIANQTEPHPSEQYIGGLESLQSIDVLDGSLFEKYNVVLTEHMYGPNPIEKENLEKIGPGIYIVSNITDNTKNEFLTALYLTSRKVPDKSLERTSDSIKARLSINTENIENWQAQNDANPESFIDLDNSFSNNGKYALHGKFMNVREGYNTRLIYTPQKSFEVRGNDSILLYLRSDFVPTSARLYFHDAGGNRLYWEISTGEAKNFAPQNGWQSDTWLKIVIPEIKDNTGEYKVDEAVPFNRTQVSKVELVLTPKDLPQANVWVDSLWISASISEELIKKESPELFGGEIPDLLSVKIPFPLAYILILFLSFFGSYSIILLKLTLTSPKIKLDIQETPAVQKKDFETV